MSQEAILENGKASGGKTRWLAHQRGERLGPVQAIKGKCYECCGGYSDGRVDCGIPGCPLYPWQPYRKRGRKFPLGGRKPPIEEKSARSEG